MKLYGSSRRSRGVGDDGGSVSDVEFAPEFSWGVLPNSGIAFFDSIDYGIRIIDPAGKLVHRLTRDDRPRRVSKSDQDAARAHLRKALSGGMSRGMSLAIRMSDRGPPEIRMGTGGGRASAMSQAEIEAEVRNMVFAEFIPVVDAISTDPVGRIWVQRTPAHYGEPGPIELITASGKYIGTINGKKRPIAVNLTGTLAAWVERDDLDVERVVVRRLPPNWLPPTDR
jgi:hypothetical protein